ncbi:MAG TPA: GNAT family N-acetyltransferase [Chitinophagaceae bacterium]|nr:GNAT family N-acetyltransferase [Chitinophagaceae bacterium]HNU15958.1 GNAT family N-acetyltransferase [Chitinophagaceae bacterium]
MKVLIEHFKPEYAPYFKSLNEAWLQEYFTVEDIDREVLGNPGKYILNDGGFILFALVKNEVVGCVAMKKVSETGFELTKMAVQKDKRGNGIGNELVRQAIFEGVLKKAKSIELYSQTELPNALHLYEKYGFVHTPMPKTIYKRSNVYMILTIK